MEMESSLPKWAFSLSDELIEELQLLQDMPQVLRLNEQSLFDRANPAGSKANQRGVIVRTACCGEQLCVRSDAMRLRVPRLCMLFGHCEPRLSSNMDRRLAWRSWARLGLAKG